ncbi:uncharacterized protein LOC141699321 [Apium graveolens]|uniref:uncharacterized protein LOC141699321 n=1 Tax=Apium graveolens TaxID=4045 RepID=UPI003D7B7447
MNYITSLRTDDGRVLSNHNELCTLLKNYYVNIFAETNTETEFPEYESQIRVTAEKNSRLTGDLSFEEFTEAIKSMHPNKASGPDGLNPAFFQHFWKLIGKEVFQYCRTWLLEAKFPATVNDTNLVLVPKKARLQRVLPGLISEEQSAFIPGRSSMDNVLVAFELIHYMKRKSSGDVGEVALKLDISKAYDRVRWGYLKKQMLSMGFSDKWAPTVTHLLFADDSFLFFKAKAEETTSIKCLLNGYELFFGQAVNFQKYAIYFSSNVRRDKQAEIKAILQVNNDLGNRKYLGLPSLVGRSKKVVFNYLKDKIWSKIKCWNTKLLSRAGKAVLLRNIAQCIPALLKARYYPDCSLLQANRTGGSGLTWSGIWEAKEFVKNGLRWFMGDGRSIHIYQDRWLRGKPNYCVDQYTQQQANRYTKVCDFLLENQKAWDERKIKSTFNTTDAEAILAVRVSQNSTRDRVAWLHTINGQFNVKSGYHLWQTAKNRVTDVQQSDGWGKLWRLCIPHKIRVFLCRLCRNNVPVRYVLREKGFMVPISCSMCTGDIEHLIHLFFECNFAKGLLALYGSAI